MSARSMIELPEPTLAAGIAGSVPAAAIAVARLAPADGSLAATAGRAAVGPALAPRVSAISSASTSTWP